MEEKNQGAPSAQMPRETVVVEIRAAEGGEDAKLLVHEQFTVYARAAVRRGL